jgi:DNA-directed RNA polymerase specialized sigma24 family protein
MREQENIQSDRCTAEDFRGLFTREANQFHWLCRALAGDDHRAQLSFEDALEQSLASANGVFREWMSSWAHRQVIKSCIRTMATEIQSAARSFSPFTIHRYLADATASEQLRTMAPTVLEQKLLALDVLSRFVIVLRIQENYSRRETALLLDVDEMTCASAYLLAAASMADPENYQTNRREIDDGRVEKRKTTENRGSYDYRETEAAIGPAQTLSGRAWSLRAG